MRLGSEMNDRTNHLPILMYHAIWSSADGSIPQASSIEHAVEAHDFGDQLDAIVYGGYNTSISTISRVLFPWTSHC